MLSFVYGWYSRIDKYGCGLAPRGTSAAHRLISRTRLFFPPHIVDAPFTLDPSRLAARSSDQRQSGSNEVSRQTQNLPPGIPPPGTQLTIGAEGSMASPPRNPNATTKSGQRPTPDDPVPGPRASYLPMQSTEKTHDAHVTPMVHERLALQGTATPRL